jgi:hypothetical protein
MTYTIVYPESSTNGDASFEVHKAGCRDLGKKPNQGNIEAPTVSAAIQKELRGEMGEIGYKQSDYKTMNCVKA